MSRQLIATNNISGGFAAAEVIDVFGTSGARPGLGQTGNFDDGKAVRKSYISVGKSVFDETEWDVYGDSATPQNVADMDPRVWAGAGSSPTSPAISSSPSVEGATAVPSLITNSPSLTPIVCVSVQDVQGNSTEAPLKNDAVKVCGARITSKVRNGFYLQDPTPEKDASYSSGVFVYTGSMDLSSYAIGNMMIVEGEASEVRYIMVSLFLIIT